MVEPISISADWAVGARPRDMPAVSPHITKRVFAMDPSMPTPSEQHARTNGDHGQPGAGRVAIENARIVTPDTEIESGHLAVAGERISAVGPGAPSRNGPRIDVSGQLVVPGLIDLHGDDIERHLAPRPQAQVPPEMARVGCEQENVSAGITTKYHALAFEEAPSDGRWPERAELLAQLLQSADDPLLDHRIHARCETGNERCVEEVIDLLERTPPDMVSLMHHAPEDGQFGDAGTYEQRYTDPPNLDRQGSTTAHREERMERIVAAAAAADVPVSSHDDASPEAVERRVKLGIDLFEYPVTMAAASKATELGVPTTMGAPNLVRGGSLWDNLNAAAAIQADVVDALCSDYHPRSLLESIFVDTREPLADRVARVTSVPAAIAGLGDRGRLVPGNRADFVVLDPESVHPVTRVFVAGSEMFHARPESIYDTSVGRP